MFIISVTVVLQLPPLAANMTEVKYYIFSLMVNGTGYDKTFEFLPLSWYYHGGPLLHLSYQFSHEQEH